MTTLITGTTSITGSIDPTDFSMVQALLDDLQASHDFELVTVERLATALPDGQVS